MQHLKKPLKRNILLHTEAEIEFHQTLGCDFAAIGGIGIQESENLERYRAFLRDARPMIEKLKAAGIRFAHHNHSHEFFRPERGGPSPEDILIDEGGDDLFLELDLYWIEHAGFNCARILERCHGRVPVIHLKDKAATRGQTLSVAEGSPQRFEKMSLQAPGRGQRR